MIEAATNLERAIEQAAGQYYRLVLLAGAPGCGKTATLQAVAKENGYSYLNVNLELSKKMLELTRTQRSRQVERLLKEVIASAPGDVVLLDNLEILFDPALEVEPLRLLQVSSRNRTIVASWNGTFKDGTLAYAEPGHPEFIQFKQAEAVIVTAVNTQS
jgi:Cdc6-like AAA superfamily ATPase